MHWKSGRSQVFFGWFEAAVLLYNLPVILWGAYVRVSFSGDGCGANWPTCNGAFLPQKLSVPMAIEYTHRMMTSVDVVAVLIMLAWAFFAFPRKHTVRRYAVFSLIFLVIEALLGAGLVLLRYVAKDQSAGRVWYLSAHLTNTMLLLAALTITAWAALSRAGRVAIREWSSPVLTALGLTVFVSITGTVAALGDTLFPVASLAGGMAQDFSNSSHLLLRLRLFHPAFALAGAGYLIWLAVRTLRGSEEGSRAHRAGVILLTLTVGQLLMGVLNLSLLAPLWTQLTHLLIADLVWIALLLLVLETRGLQLLRQPALSYSRAAGRA